MISAFITIFSKDTIHRRDAEDAEKKHFQSSSLRSLRLCGEMDCTFLERTALDSDIDPVQRVRGGDDHGSGRCEGQADDAGAGEEEVGAAVGVDADDALAAGNRGGDVEAALLVEGHALGPAEAAIEGLDFALAGNPVDGIEAGSGGAGDVEIAVGTKREVVGRDGGFQRGEDEDLAVGADLENGAAAVADVKVAFAVEGEAGGYTHAFDVNRHVAVGGDLVDETVVAAGDVEHPLLVEGHGGGVHQLVDERLHVEVQVDAVYGDGDLLAAGAAERRVDIAERVDGGAGDGVEGFGDEDADIASPGFAGNAAAFDDQFTGRSTFRDAGDDERVGADHDGGTDFADHDTWRFLTGESLAADLQFTAGNGGGRCDLDDLRLGIRRFPERHRLLIKIEPSCQPQHKCGIDACHGVVGVDAQAFGKGFKLADGSGFPDVEEAE